MKKPKRIPIYKSIWCKIRYWQMIYDMSDEELALILGIGNRTIREYDKCADNLTLCRVDKFLVATGMTLDELLCN